MPTPQIPSPFAPTSHESARDQMIREWNIYSREDRSLMRPSARRREDERFRHQFHLFGIDVPRELEQDEPQPQPDPRPSPYGRGIAASVQPIMDELEGTLPSGDTIASWARDYIIGDTNAFPNIRIEPGAVNYHVAISDDTSLDLEEDEDPEMGWLEPPQPRPQQSLGDLMREHEEERLRREPRPLPRSRATPPAEAPAWRKYPKLLSTGRPQSGKTMKLFREMLAIPDYDIVYISNHRESSMDMWKMFLKDSGIAFSFSDSSRFVIRKDTEKKIHFRHLDTEIKSFLRGMGPHVPIFIDNLDLCLSNIVGNHGTLVSLTWNIE